MTSGQAQISPQQQVDSTTGQTDVAKAILWYGFFVLILGGGAGVWLPLIIGKPLSIDGLVTYVFSILAPLVADAVLHEPYWNRVKKSKKMMFLGICGVSAVLALASLVREGKSWDWTLGVGATLLAIWYWYITANLSGRFEPEGDPPKGSMGGKEVSTETLEGDGLA